MLPTPFTVLQAGYARLLSSELQVLYHSSRCRYYSRTITENSYNSKRHSSALEIFWNTVLPPSSYTKRRAHWTVHYSYSIYA
jgi:hypothetical protein